MRRLVRAVLLGGVRACGIRTLANPCGPLHASRGMQGALAWPWHFDACDQWNLNVAGDVGRICARTVCWFPQPQISHYTRPQKTPIALTD